MSDPQLLFPFLQRDAADEIAHAVVARLVDIVHQESCPGFRWSERANLKLVPRTRGPRGRTAAASEGTNKLRIRAQHEWRAGRLPR